MDCDELAVGFHFSDQSYVVPKINEEHYIEELLDIIEKENIDLILPTSNDVIPLSMNKDNIDAMMFMSDYDVIETCVDKFLFYKTCQSSFPLPKTTNEFIPIFAKPREGKGSVGVELIDRSIEDYVYQEYLPGTEYTIDVLCDMDSNVLSVIPRIRLQTKAGISTKGRIIRNKFIENTCKEMAEFLNLKGPVCMQMKEDKYGDPKFIEINPRFGGGTYFTTLSGVNFVKIILDLVKGKKIVVPEPKEITVLRCFKEVVCF